MTGNNLLATTSIAPQVLVSQQLSNTDAALYTVPASTSAKLTQGSLCNVSASLVTTLTLGSTTSGGAFTAGTYYWVITATNAAGETIASNEVVKTVTTNQQQALSWTAVGGATNYNVYRGTATGAENKLIVTQSGLSYTDTGTAGTTQSPPANSTFGQAILVYLSIVKTGGTLGDGTHRIINRYSLAISDTLSLRDYIGDAMLGPADLISGFASITNSIDVVLTGTVHT